MDIISSAILGFIQGITEFLPVSSTGHLVLMHSLLGVENESSLAFDAILHIATAFAVVVYFWNELYMLAQTLFRKMGRLPVNPKDVLILQAIAVGVIPAVVMGLLLEDYMSALFRNPILVALVLISGSLFFMYAEYMYDNNFHVGEVDAKMGFKIGLFQTLALIPGFSRSGATIAGGMVLCLSRTESARFSFLLAIPVILGAGAKKILELLSEPVHVEWVPIGVGGIIAFTVGIFAIHFMLSFVKKYSLWVFIWYRITLAAFVLFVTFFG